MADTSPERNTLRTQSETKLKAIVLTPLLALLVACGGGSDSSENVITNPPEPAQDGISGVAASSIGAGQISITDANGDELVIASGRETNQNGRFNLVFSEFAIEAGINPPLLLTLQGNGATAICDYDQEGESDCLTADGSFVAFGERYNLRNGFRLRAIAETYPPASTPEDRSVTVNFSAASDLAAQYAVTAAGPGPLTEEIVALAERQALGAVEFITGLSTEGSELNEISIADLTSPQIYDTPSLALALFSASLQGQVDLGTENLANFRRVLDTLESSILPVPGSSDNQLRATSEYLANAVNAYLSGASSFQLSLPEPSGVLNGAITAQSVAENQLRLASGQNIRIALPALPGSDDSLARGKTLVDQIAAVMGGSLLVSTVDAFGGTAAGAAAVYGDQLALVTALTSGEVRTALSQLDNAIATALASGETQLSGTNVSGILTVEGDSVSLANATSTSSNIQTGIAVNLTIPTGTRLNPGGSGEFSATEFLMSVAQTQNDLTTQQLFQGELELQMVDVGDTADIDSIGFTGELRSREALEFNGQINALNLSRASDPVISGDYSASFIFDGDFTLSLAGKLESQLETYTASTAGNTVMTDLLTATMTNLNATLNLTIDSGQQVTGGNIVAAEEIVGTMDDQGFVNFIDGTQTVLPVPVI